MAKKQSKESTSPWDGGVEPKELISGSRTIEYMPVSGLEGATRNPKKHSETIPNSINRFGFIEPMVLDERTGRLVAGHGRKDALLALEEKGEAPPQGILLGDDGRWRAPILRGWSSRSDSEAEAYLLASNRLTELGGWDEAGLAEMIQQLGGAGELEGTGFEAGDAERLLKQLEQEAQDAGPHAKLSDKFLVPPFSVLDARQGYWRERKRQWLRMGIRSEEGRGENLLNTMGIEEKTGFGTKDMAFSGGVLKGAKMKNPGHNAHLTEEGKKALGGYAVYGGADALDRSGGGVTGTSVFDPVLCELIYRWFCPPGGQVVDPFAGGSVRGIVAAKLGYDYAGVELRGEQVESNRAQAVEICKGDKVPRWEQGDSRNISAVLRGCQADLVFSCPPYMDLEVYSDDPKDISQMSDEDFREAYASIINQTVGLLKPNRFACFVVGEVRETKGGGFYRGFVPLTIELFEAAGARFYNEAILVTSAGTLPLRVSSFFPNQRKLGKTHQNVLLFFKGDPEQIATEFPPIEVPSEALEGEASALPTETFGEEL